MKMFKTEEGTAMGARKFGQEIRHGSRALSVVNQNLAGAPLNPTAVSKRNLPEKLAAQQKRSGRQQCAEESKRLKSSVIRVDEEANTKDHPVPMFLEQSSNEMGHQEVEMVDIFEDTILDIDGCDAGDPLSAVEYVDDMYAHYKKMECHSCVPHDYMALQFDINERMRSILIDWLIEVQHKFQLRDETLFLTVHLVDRFLAKQVVARKRLQLVGLIATLLACKYEEISVPFVDDLVYISAKAYTKQEVLDMERLMLHTLQFNLSFPTPYVFMIRFLKAAQSDQKLEHLSFYLIELCLVEYEMLRFSPSMLAAAAIYTARCAMYACREWSKTCEWHTSYSEHQLLECSRLVVGIHEKAGTGRLTGAYRKYSTPKYGFTVKCEPARFLLETTGKA